MKEGVSSHQLVEQWRAAACRIALRIARRLPSWISREDLISAALVGLVEAADRYDANHGEAFMAFAEPRIRGAVTDELRRGDLLPRRIRSLLRKMAHAVENLERRQGSEPRPEEVAAALGLSLQSYREVETLGSSGYIPLDPNAQEIAVLSRECSRTPEDETIAREVFEALDDLDDRDRTVLSMYYIADLSEPEIADFLKVAPSRVNQIRARALVRLRKRLRIECTS